MFDVKRSNQALTITITDPSDLERLAVVLTRSNSSKIAQLREAIKAALTEAPAQASEPAVVPADLLAQLAELEALESKIAELY